MTRRQDTRTTIGSTKAVQSSAPSNSASTKDTAADARRIKTNWSWNCSSTSFHSGVDSSSARAGCVKARSAPINSSSHHPSRGQLTIWPVLLSRLQDLVLRQPCFLGDLEMPQHLRGRASKRLLHGSAERQRAGVAREEQRPPLPAVTEGHRQGRGICLALGADQL